MKWLLLTMSVAVTNPAGLEQKQSGPYFSREACLLAARLVIQEQTNLKTYGKLRVSTLCVPQGKG